MSLAARTARSIFAISLCLATCTTLHAQTPDLSHNVKFEIGDTFFLDGDAITIDSITGPTDTIEPGHAYLVTGTYKLASHPDAMLSSNVTSGHDSGARQRVEGHHHSSVAIQQGEGRFSVYLNMDTSGYPHISFYPSGGGNSFAGVYFGMGNSLMGPRHHDGATPIGTDRVGTR